MTITMNFLSQLKLCGAHFDCSRRIVAFAAATNATTTAAIAGDVVIDVVVVNVSKIEPIIVRHVTASREFRYCADSCADACACAWTGIGKRNICKI